MKRFVAFLKHDNATAVTDTDVVNFKVHRLSDYRGKTVILDDLFTDPNRNLVSFDAKNGPGARLTPNQAVEYPRINQGTPVTPRGPNAQSANSAPVLRITLNP